MSDKKEPEMLGTSTIVWDEDENALAQIRYDGFFISISDYPFANTTETITYTKAIQLIANSEKFFKDRLSNLIAFNKSLLKPEKRVVVKCMLCIKTTKSELSSELSLWHHFNNVSGKKEWQMLDKNKKMFICCPDCINKAYNPNGSLGFLKEEFEDKMIEDRSIEKGDLEE